MKKNRDFNNPGFIICEECLHIYIDESGDSGFKLTEGSTPYFIITLVVFHTDNDILQTVNSIYNLEKINHLPNPFEWKFSKTRAQLCIKFLNTINKFDFSIRSVIMNKNKIYGTKLKSDADHFYNYTCKLALQYAKDSLSEAKIIFDKRGPNKFYTHLKQYLRKECALDHTKIKKIKSADSKKEKPLQIADMITGAIARSLNTQKKDHDDYVKIIKHKIENIFTFPDDLNN